jgi:hypothetical protein
LTIYRTTSGGVLLSAASHLHNSSQAGRLIFGAYLGVVMTHFVIDAGIWRMRDPLARKFITENVPFLRPGMAPRDLAQPPRQPALSEGIPVTDRSSTDIGCAS